MTYAEIEYQIAQYQHMAMEATTCRNPQGGREWYARIAELRYQLRMLDAPAVQVLTVHGSSHHLPREAPRT